MVAEKWLELSSLMVTSAELVSSKISEKGLCSYSYLYLFILYVFRVFNSQWFASFFNSDLECTYTIICSIVKNAKSPEQVLEMVKAIASKVAQQPSDKASLRLKMYESFLLISECFAHLSHFSFFFCLNLCVASSISITWLTTRMLDFKYTWKLLH